MGDVVRYYVTNISDLLIRYYFPECDTFKIKKIDVYWVEATYLKARQSIFPLLTPEAIEESIYYVNSSHLLIDRSRP